MKNNRQIGLDGRIFITDCLSDSIFFVYSIILSGLLGAAGDIMKLLGESRHAMDALTNGLILCDLVCSLSMVIVTYYVYFMHCGENIPKLGTKPLIYLEYLRLGYYGVLAYEVLYRLARNWQSDSGVPAAIPIFYMFYFAWLICCMCAAMFILTVLHQNVIRRSYAQSFKWLSLIGLGVNVVLPLVYFITRIWVRGSGDGFYSAGLCDFVRLAVAPIFYAAIWFLFMNAIDQVDKVFSEVDNAIRDKRYRIEFDEESDDRQRHSKKKTDGKKKSGGKKKKSANQKTEADKSVSVSSQPEPAEQAPASPVTTETEAEPTSVIEAEPVVEQAPEVEPLPEVAAADSGDIVIDAFVPVISAEKPAETESSEPVPTVFATEAEEDDEAGGAKRVKPKKKHRITQVEEDATKVKASKKGPEELAAELFEALDAADAASSEASDTEHHAE